MLKIFRFSYDDDGQLLEVRENSHVWQYEYDTSGNMVKLGFGSSKHSFRYDENDVLVEYNGAKLAHDSQVINIIWRISCLIIFAI